jgi:DNA topoisomerase IA
MPSKGEKNDNAHPPIYPTKTLPHKDLGLNDKHY